MQLFFVKICEKVLDKVGISVSKSLIPNDMRPVFAPSGLRIGTPAMTTRGMSESDYLLYRKNPQSRGFFRFLELS